MTDQIAKTDESESKPIRLLYSFVAAGTALTTSAAFVEFVPRWVVGVLGLAVLGVSAFLARWTEKQVTPWVDVAAKVTPSGQVIAGPAAHFATGSLARVEPTIRPTTVPRHLVEDPTAVDPSVDPAPGAGNGMNPPYPGA